MSVVLSRPKRRRPQWHKLRVADVERLTDEAVTVAFEVPEDLRETFDFTPGQHLTLRRFDDGEEVRRSYSICSTPSHLRSSGVVRVGIKKIAKGSFSGYATTSMRPGDVVELLPPLGTFTTQLDPARSRHYAGIVAGSGITPVMSIAASALETEPESRVTLVYGNRSAATVMFADAIADLKDRFPDRFQLIHVLSREPQAAELLSGRLDEDRLGRIFASLLPIDTVDDWFLCGPYGMVIGAQKVLSEAGVTDDHIHHELFYAEEIPDEPEQAPVEGETALTVTLDGRASTVTMRRDERVLDAALRVRPELPYACKGGVCATCRAKLLDGDVHMARNYALEQSDVDNGYVLTCQSTPTTDEVAVDYDA
ncbi:1,2-phenylacetyl-CoA epoxidase subunit PaaE [Stackebrandtia nassauensis]|uniref:Phenylacetate-CoA oxygenase/reductase, PaaK subunit n=1 Tax=Stackebrandtia nassauensis (strain DSM 44728 / CIP 108903 / NRRL B-16338 / NBRC 102104 / LLR-40K-21) TaxID=446470 RepID=D3PU06_STANL|nr:1,2-phenylacetyl-CoA epoxidase subunit PaaE [Stackebrandtia nassauensis]ADD40952.1 phenylacetate-CoA oxygenase/reductase, PaaK subunit [Stackebrandtia nassauensis DSM 44728]